MCQEIKIRHSRHRPKRCTMVGILNGIVHFDSWHTDFSFSHPNTGLVSLKKKFPHQTELIFLWKSIWNLMLKICFPKLLGENVIFSLILYHKPFILFFLTYSFLFMLFFTLLDVAQYCERQISKETIHLDLSFHCDKHIAKTLKSKLLIFIFYVKALEKEVQKWSLKDL